MSAVGLGRARDVQWAEERLERLVETCSANERVMATSFAAAPKCEWQSDTDVQNVYGQMTTYELWSFALAWRICSLYPRTSSHSDAGILSDSFTPYQPQKHTVSSHNAYLLSHTFHYLTLDNVRDDLVGQWTERLADMGLELLLQPLLLVLHALLLGTVLLFHFAP